MTNVPVLGPVLGQIWAHFGPDLGLILGQIWAHFGPDLGPFWARFWAHFGPDFGPILGQILSPFWARFWTHFGPDFGPILGPDLGSILGPTYVYILYLHENHTLLRCGPGAGNVLSLWRAVESCRKRPTPDLPNPMPPIAFASHHQTVFGGIPIQIPELAPVAIKTTPFLPPLPPNRIIRLTSQIGHQHNLMILLGGGGGGFGRLTL